MHGEHILVVDDQEESVEIINALLATHFPDIPTAAAYDGETALAHVENQPPALVILDVKMPGMDGFEVCRRLKENPVTVDIPILMVSGVLIRTQHRVRGLTLGADGYICKPFEPQELAAQVRTLLRLKRKSDALRARGKDLEKELEKRAGALLKSEEKYRTLVEQLPAAIYILEVGPPRRTTFVSPQIESFLGFPRDGWLGESKLWRDQIHPEDRAAIRDMWAEHDRTGQPFSLEYRMLSLDGNAQWFRNEGMYLNDADGRPATIHGVLLDVTDRKRAEEALRESEEKLQQAQKMEALGRLSGGVAHDFNNLLTTILGYGRLLQDQIEDDAIRADVNEIIHAGERAEDLTRRLLAFGHKQVAELLPLDLNDVVFDMDRLLRRTLGNDIELVTLLGEGLGYIHVDEGQLSQIILNLAVNARNAMPTGGKLSLRTSRVALDSAFCADRPDLKPGPYVLLEITDSGCGIQSDLKDRIFEPFFTTRRKGEGTGLGLSIVYGIVRQCAGHIELESQVDQGTCFRIYFPIIDGTPARNEVRETETLPKGSETILLVEDEPAVRRLAVRLLEELGYQVVEARHGGDALRRFDEAEGRIDLVLADVVMPHLGGPELVQELALRVPEIRVLFTTGYARQPYVKLKGRQYPILMKPYSRESLARSVRRVLDEERQSG